jgi:hypothetical protein
MDKRLRQVHQAMDKRLRQVHQAMDKRLSQVHQAMDKADPHHLDASEHKTIYVR